MPRARWWPLVRAPVGLALVTAGFAALVDGEGDVTAVAAVNRAVGGSFIACGLVAWWRRPDNGTGPLMTLTGFLYLAPPLLAEAGSDALFTLSELVANWWIVTFAALVLAFSDGRVTARLDRGLLAALAFGIAAVQVLCLAFLPFPAGDGVGGAHAGPGSGLRGLADRVEALGGCLTVHSPDGEGTGIRAEMPCARPAARA